MILLAIALSLPLNSSDLNSKVIEEYYDLGPVGHVTADPGDYASSQQDVGFGKCPAFQHAHNYDPQRDPSLDGKCHRDEDDSVIEPRVRLPKP